MEPTPGETPSVILLFRATICLLRCDAMPYTHVLIYTPEGECLGYGIRKPAPALQLKSVNIWTEEEQGDVQEQLNRLNADVSLRTHWPKLDRSEEHTSELQSLR